MDISTTLKITYTSLRSKGTRTFLTMLGIIIGIASVIIILSVGAGAQSLILNQIKSFGSNLISIFPGASEENGPPPSVFGSVNADLTADDIEALVDKTNAPNVVAITYYVQGTGVLIYQNNQTDSTFIATTSRYPEVHDTQVESGRFFTEEEEKSLAKVVVIGSQVKEDLFGEVDPLGKEIKINKKQFQVIGVMETRGVEQFQNQDTLIYIPISTGQKVMLGIDYISLARVKVNAPENLEQTITDIRYILRDRHDLRESEVDDFSVRSQAQAIDIFSSVTNSLTFFLAAIAAISLLVGGIGIMNIMLITVSERTREVGLRKALGAKNSNILSQFLIESVAVTLAGGIIGIILGIFISLGVAFVARYLGYDWDFIISISSIFLSSTIAVIVGVVFGIYPALKASKLNPIEALRYE